MQRVRLEGHLVALEPLERAHVGALCEAGLDEDLWSYTTIRVATPEDMAAYVDDALAAEAAGAALPFVIRLRSSGQIVGTTRLYSYVESQRRIDLGFTWIAAEFHRTGVNRESKYLLLRHAFEQLGVNRVGFWVAAGNQRSIDALLALGASREGLFRQYMMSARRGACDVHVFSILASEWPRIKEALETPLEKKGRPEPPLMMR